MDEPRQLAYEPLGNPPAPAPAQGALSWGRLTKGTSLLLANEAICNVCSLAKNVVLARFLSKADFGIAAVLTTVVAFADVASKMCFGQKIITDPNGAQGRFVATAHAMQLSASVFSAVLLFLLAAPLATLLECAHLSWAFRTLAAVPLCLGLTSLSPWTYVRDMRYGRSVSVEAVPQVVTALLAWPVAARLADFRAVLCLLIGKSLFSALTSHLVSGAPFRLAWAREYVGPILGYTGPLLLSSFMMIGILQGDRLLIAGAYPLSRLGEYAAAAMLAATPSFVVMKIGTALSLPILSAAQSEGRRLARRARTLTLVYGSTAVFFMLVAAGLGEELAVLTFGGRYAGIGPLLGWLACGNAVRIVRNAPTNISMGLGNARLQLVSNGIRLAGTLAIVPVLWLRGPLIYVAAIGALAEWMALAQAVHDTKKSHHLRVGLSAHLSAALCVAVAAAGHAAHLALPSHCHLWVGLAASGVGLAGLAALWLKLFRRRLRSLEPAGCSVDQGGEGAPC